MRIYRVEFTDGLGPQASGAACTYYTYARAAMMDGREPVSEHDPEHIAEAEKREVFPPTLKPGEMFGCKSLEQLRRWLPSRAGCKGLDAVGCTLCAFEARDSDVYLANLQVVFNRLTATFLWNVPVGMLHTLTDEEAAAMPSSQRIFPEPISALLEIPGMTPETMAPLLRVYPFGGA